MRYATSALVLFAACYRGGDGPQRPYTEPTDLPGKCDACYATEVSLGAVTGIWSGITIAALAMSRDRPNDPIDRRWLYAGIGLGVTTLAVGTTHAVINRDDLASKAIVPGIIGVAVGVPAIVSGVIGLRRAPVVPTPITVPGGGGVAISGRF